MQAFFESFPQPDPDTGAFQFRQGAEWVMENNKLMAVCAVSYMPVIWVLGKVMERFDKAPNLRIPLILWNGALATFSIMGAYHTVPLLASRALKGEPLAATVCDTSLWDWPSSYWLFLFCLSKVPEFVDTIFLRLRKRPVIFLHWFHHIVTMVYCWYTAGHTYKHSAAGIYFAVMNLCVHSIMYTYYAIAAMGYGRVLARLSLNIVLTTSQIMQMACGVYVVLQSRNCPTNTDEVGYYFALSMYAVYFILFLKLFYDKYMDKPKRAAKRVKQE